jgi:hypothetical protein
MRKTSRSQVHSFVAKTRAGLRQQDAAQYVTHEASDLGSETRVGSSLLEGFGQMTELVDERGGELAVT